MRILIILKLKNDLDIILLSYKLITLFVKEMFCQELCREA